MLFAIDGCVGAERELHREHVGCTGCLKVREKQSWRELETFFMFDAFHYMTLAQSAVCHKYELLERLCDHVH